MTKHFGLYHATSQGRCSWQDFSTKFFQISDTKIKLSKADPFEFQAKTPRPNYSVLENYQLQKLNLDYMPHWKVALKRYLEVRKMAP